MKETNPLRCYRIDMSSVEGKKSQPSGLPVVEPASVLLADSEPLSSSYRKSRTMKSHTMDKTPTEKGLTFDGYTIPTEDKIHLYQQLSLMLNAGIPMMRALASLSGEKDKVMAPTDQPAESKHSVRRLFKLQKGESVSKDLVEAPKYIQKRGLGQLALLISRNIHKGLSLPKTMERLPGVFSDYEVYTVHAAEKGGHLVQALVRLGENEEEILKNTLELKKALAMPLLVSVLSLLFFVTIPGLLFDFMIEDGTLSAASTFPARFAYYMVSSSQLLVHPITLLVGLAAFVALILSWRNPAKKRRVIRTFWKVACVVPGIRRYRNTALAQRFVLTFNMLNKTGFPVHHAVQLALESCGDPDYAERKTEVLERLKGGEKLHQALDFLPSIAIVFIEIGEEAGTLDRSLSSVEAYLNSELLQTREVALTLLEPFMMVFVGGLVGLLAVSVLSAISSMVTF